ncbi:unnamed protein product [Discula destructiva]
MDAYSMTCTSPSLRHMSRIYQDLRSKHFQSISGVTSTSTDKARDRMATMANTQHDPNDGRPTPHIGIIGAGLAGLRCAHILQQHGMRVTVLEGRDRLGGRVHQARLANGHTVDVGPNWIHGTDDNPMLDIARATHTATGSFEDTTYVFGADGTLYGADESKPFSTLMWNIVQAAFRYSNKHSAEIDPATSLLDFFRTKVVEVVPETEPDLERTRSTVLQMADLWGAFVGSPIERQSLKFFWLEECIDGENLFCSGTYTKILAHIAAPVIAGDVTIRLNTTVAKIHARTRPDETIRVTLADTEAQLAFDQVVVTSPLGWLQKHHAAAFDPSLPAPLAKAIHSISYGCLEKVYISFPKAFWLTPDPNVDRRRMQGFAQWLSPSFATDTNPERWTIEVVELASLGNDVGHPTLLFYIYGAQSAHIVNSLTTLSTQTEKDKFLLDFFSPYYSRLPNYSPTSPDCTPMCTYATTWLADDLAGNGSYSNFQVGLQEGDRDIQVMREGWLEGGVWLAGEHTAPFVALGTATGAYWAGESVGRRLVEAYGRNGRYAGSDAESKMAVDA